jgi:hypothetical protein
MYMYYICGLWPPDNVSCIFPTLSSPRPAQARRYWIYFLGDIEAIRGGGNLNPKKVVKRTKIGHKKLLMKVGLNKDNIL